MMIITKKLTLKEGNGGSIHFLECEGIELGKISRRHDGTFVGYLHLDPTTTVTNGEIKGASVEEVVGQMTTKITSFVTAIIDLPSMEAAIVDDLKTRSEDREMLIAEVRGTPVTNGIKTTA